ncbi:hypothetical protein [Sphingomonas sp. Root710]|uniref:hypothetical protein n=1 Tax=Sphingomonas sp. Root710 TaxID=1736594 RepID=UPI00138ECBF5|nr:hypothetical protein [Sphingomonas sp. Root710]
MLMPTCQFVDNGKNRESGDAVSRESAIRQGILVIFTYDACLMFRRAGRSSVIRASIGNVTYLRMVIVTIACYEQPTGRCGVAGV